MNGEKYYIDNDILKLNNKGIQNIIQIKNLDHFSDLKELHLSSSLISNIKGIDKLENLELRQLNYNKIKIILLFGVSLRVVYSTSSSRILNPLKSNQ